MPRTTYRFRVAPIIIIEGNDDGSKPQKVDLGEWSETTNISTKDNLTFDCSYDAEVLIKGKSKSVIFEQPALV